MQDDIEHLDIELDPVSKVAMVAREALEDNDEEAAIAVLVTRDENGAARVFWTGHSDHALISLQKGLNLMGQRLGL